MMPRRKGAFVDPQDVVQNLGIGIGSFGAICLRDHAMAGCERLRAELFQRVPQQGRAQDQAADQYGQD